MHEFPVLSWFSDIVLESHSLHSTREHSDSVAECLTQDQGAEGSSLYHVTALKVISKQKTNSLPSHLFSLIYDCIYDIKHR